MAVGWRGYMIKSRGVQGQTVQPALQQTGPISTYHPPHVIIENFKPSGLAVRSVSQAELDCGG